MKTSQPQQDLVLLGGGHSHALALRRLAMKPMPGVRITLVSEGSYSPYSGMLPGLVAGHYSFEDTHIDLSRLCAKLGVRFIVARVVGLDPKARKIRLQGRPDLSYDILSINTGAQPDIHSVAGAAEFATPVKPVSGFYQRWLELEQKHSPGTSCRAVVVGGGAGSVELALAMAHSRGSLGLQVMLVCGGALLDGYNRAAVRSVRKALVNEGVELQEHARVDRIESDQLFTVQATAFPYDELIWCTAAAAEAWLAESGLPCDERGFLRLEDTLKVQGQERIFAAGDVATQVSQPRPKAGVYAVRQAPVLADNLRACARGEALGNYRPQRRFLSLLSLGGRLAVADRGLFSAGGEWVWRWKDSIDRKFMAQFLEPPAQMTAVTDDAPGEMHCGGCGAKLPAKLLREVLSNMSQRFPAVVDLSKLRDDAAVLQQTPGTVLVQSVDSLRELVDDPWMMGRIAALHALSDLHAMGAKPHSCLAQITLAHGAPGVQQRDLELLMDGALTEMAKVGCQLLGGHSLEGAELSIGFTVNGEVEPAQLLHKAGAEAGSRLILSKPLGTGVLFAAQAEGGVDGSSIDAAQSTMLQGNAGAAAVARQFELKAATDVTGFGLLGHLLEMLHGQSLQARLALDSIPVLAGVRQAYAAGYASSLQPGNIAAVADQLSVDTAVDDNRLQALFDPQTSGGLLLAVPAQQAQAVLQSLHASGYQEAADIGELQLLPTAEGKLHIGV